VCCALSPNPINARHFLCRPEVGLPGRYVSKKTGRLVPQAMYIVNKVDYIKLPQAMNHHAALLHGDAIGMIPGPEPTKFIRDLSRIPGQQT
jgi:hypothetical protein